MTNFSDLGLSAPLLKVLPELNIEHPTKIQAQAIPMLLENKNRDFLGLAQTGTGKTAAFGLPLLELTDAERHQTQALVLAPTRELGQQIAQQLQAFAKYMKEIKIQVVYGGASIVPQMKALKNTPQIIIATPGRLLDLINRRSINLAHIQYVVFDEADEMLNMGFREDIDRILSFVKGDKATWLFSATMAPELKKIVNKYMDNPGEVKIDTANIVNQNIEHLYFAGRSKDKLEIIKRMIELEPDMRGIIFCRTKRETQQLAEILQEKGLPVDAIHGDLSQTQRDAVMNRFKKHRLEFLIATDVAARGIDVNDLTHVVHYSMPDDLEYYTHRSGRTGRAGKTGISIALVNPGEKQKIKHIERKLKITFSPYKFPDAHQVASKKLHEWADKLLNEEVERDGIEKHGEEIKTVFESLSKEELLDRLMAREIKRLGIATKESFERQSLEEPGGKRANFDTVRYFINLGVVDGFNQKELAQLIAETSGVPKKSVSNVKVEEKRSFFDLDESSVHLVAPSFEGFYFDDRQIRINPAFQDKFAQKRKYGNKGGKKNRTARQRSGRRHT